MESSADTQDSEGDQHRAHAVAANNAAWEYLDGRDHGPDDIDDLLAHVYAAAYHWKRATGSTAVHLARASWLISRAHSVLGHADLALHHAAQSASFVEQAGALAADFDHGYAAEASARALACAGRLDDAAVAHAKMRAIEVADAQDREIFEGDADTEPWFGLDRQ